MAWYTRDLLLGWCRRFAEGESEALAHEAAGHAPSMERDWYFYKVGFVDASGRPGVQVPGRWGNLLEHTDKFPGWALALVDYKRALEAMNRTSSGIVYLL